MASKLGPLLLVGGAAIGGLLLFSGSASAKPRLPWLREIPVPGNGTPWASLDDAICFCSQAGETDSAALVLCSLQRVYPEVPWPHHPGDHATVLRTWQAVGERVAAFVGDLAAGRNPCAIIEVPDDEPVDIDPVGPGGEEPGAAPEIGPFITGRQPGFYRITGGNPTTAVRAAYGLQGGQTQRIRDALACTAATGWNLMLYSRPQNGNDYGRALVEENYYDIGPAWLPANANARVEYNTGERLLRQIRWNGTKRINGSFGLVWMPPMQLVEGSMRCVYSDPWDPRRNPPPSVLAGFGWTIEEMRDAWREGQA